MSSFFATVSAIWTVLFGWMPTTFAVICTVFIGLVILIILFKLIAFVMDIIPFI